MRLTFPALHGLRVMGCFSVMIVHVLFFSSWFMIHPEDMLHLSSFTKSLNSIWSMSGFYAVDIFFVMSGLLLANSQHHQPSSPFRILLRRYLRLAVPYFLIALLFSLYFHNPNCLSLTELLFISLLFSGGTQEQMCIQTGWSLQTDWQIYVCIVFLIALLGPDTTTKMVPLSIIFSVFSRGAVWWWLSFPLLSTEYGIASMVENKATLESLISLLGPPSFDYSNPSYSGTREEVGEGFNSYYVSTLARAGPMLMGYFLFFLLLRHQKNFKREKKMEGGEEYRWWNALILSLSGSLMALCFILNPFSFYPALVLGGWWEILHRHIFSLSICGVIYATTMDPLSPIARFLSHRFFQILSPYSFVIYLVHSAFVASVWITIPPIVSPTGVGVIINTLKMGVLSLLVAVPLFEIDKRLRRMMEGVLLGGN